MVERTNDWFVHLHVTPISAREHTDAATAGRMVLPAPATGRGAVDRRARRGERGRVERRLDVLAGLPPVGHRVATGGRPPRSRASRRRPATRARSCSPLPMASGPPPCRHRMEALFAEVARVPDVTAVVSPYTAEGARQVAARRRRGLRHRAVRPYGREDPGRARSSDIRASRRRRRRCRRPRRPRRAHVPGVRRPRTGRAHRHPRRHRDPAGRVRLADRDGSPDPRRAVRHRHRARARRAPELTSSPRPTSGPSWRR